MKRPRWMGALALVALATLFLFSSSSAPVNAQGISIDDDHNTLTVTDANQGDSVIIRGTLTNVSDNDYPSALTAVFFREVGGDIALDDVDLSWWAGAPGWQPAGPLFATNYPGYEMELTVGGSGFPLPPDFAGAGTWIKAVPERDFDTVEIKVITYVDSTGNQRYDVNEAIISELGAVIDDDIQIDLVGDSLDAVYVDDDWAGCDVGDPASNVPTEELASGKFCQINAFATVQEAIDAVTPGGTVDVYPGTYDQDEANGRNPNTGGAGSNDFNIFVNKALTIEGVDASGDPITDYEDVAAYVSPKRDTGGGHTDTVFVQADDVTITGLDIAGWTGVNYENQKTLESIGDNLTVKYNQLHGMDGAAALYMYDPRFDPDTDTSYVQSYLVEANLLDGGGMGPSGIRISSGPGWSGDVSGRVISGNTFDNNCDAIAFVGPQADPWDRYPVGAATITGNSFSRSDRRHVVAWGTYGGGLGYGDIDWDGIVENNTFDKAAITWTSLGDARSWDVAPQFYNVRGIYSAIQRYAINKAQNDDTIQVLPGLYPETLNIESFSNLSIVGDDRDTVIIKPASTLGWNVGGYGTSRQAAVRVVSSTGVDLSNMTFDFDTVKGNLVHGVLYWDSTGVISGNALKNMSLPDALAYYEITAYVRAPSYTDGARAEVEFSDNVFTETGRLGIVTHDFVHATIQGNTFTKTINDFGYAMEIGSRSTATVTGNTISGYDTPAASDGSTAAGIYIENSFTGPLFYPPSGLPHIVKPVTISGNTITGNQYGVWIGNEFDGYAGDIDVVVTMTGNNVHDNTDGGVYVVDEGREYGSSVTLNASGNSVVNNGDTGYWFNAYGDGELHANLSDETLSGQGDGIRMDNTAGGDSLYDLHIGPNNDIFDNDNGVIGFSVSGIVIDGNHIHNNVNRTQDAGVGIDLWGDNDNNQILNNVIHDNDRQGVFVGNCDFAGPYGECTAAGTPISNDNVISGNTIYNNGRNTNPNPPDASAYGIQLWNADGNTISGNEIYGHDDWFPYPDLYPTYDFAQGIYLIDSNDNAVTGNNLHGNNYGVAIWGPNRADGSNQIHGNSIAGNTGYGVRSYDSAFEVDATGNWWGHVTGPYHPTKNPGGLGDKVSDYVLFDPWLHPGDLDMDGVPDAIDNCPTVVNPGQENVDGGRRPNGSVIAGDWASNPAQDRMGDACDPDNDNDALPDTSEFSDHCPYRLVADSDGDAVMDGFEVAVGFNPCNAASKPGWEGGSDIDSDGLQDGLERSGYNTCAFPDDTIPGFSTCAAPVDSDGDGCADVLEVMDINGDRRVSIGDQTLLAKRAALILPPSDSDPIFDVNKDGRITIGDQTLMAKNTCVVRPGQLGCPVCPAE